MKSRILQSKNTRLHYSPQSLDVMVHSYYKSCITVLAILFALCADADEYMMPNQIPWLSTSLITELKEEGCKIPRNIDSYFTTGVVVGQFVARGQIDIAILCVTDSKKVIKIIWGGNKSCPSELDSIGQSITVVDGDYIWERYDAYGGNKPPGDIIHEAINDHYLGKASTVYYCHNGKWIELTGAD
ncbi:hypothetical protein [Sulfuriflexus mobilis]|uniref:hypothetical protein n=1 Tax=Sulfuriflexus mobilis TaxID=1811807 RepID=UPI000F843F9B|nr:hypothetical protein [Sulfuriflexus mobilis]